MTNSSSEPVLKTPMLENQSALPNVASEAHNAAQPVNRLPPEILTTIFKAWLGSRGSFPEPTSGLLHRHRELKSLCTTCKHWYEVAKTLPDLWTTIIPNETRITRAPESVQFAKQRPLTVLYRLSGQSGKMSAPALLRLAGAFDDMVERVSHLYLTECYWGTVWILMRSQAPLLESLSLELGARNFEIRNEEPGQHWALNRMPLLFGGHTPELKQLHLLYAPRWRNEFKNLTYICLMDQPQAGRYSLSEFLEFLSCSPRLEKLKLHNAGPACLSLSAARSADNDSPPPTVSLDSLQVLELAKFDPYIYQLEHLVRRLTLPTNCLRLIRPRAATGHVPAAFFHGTAPTQELVISTSSTARGVAKRDGLLTVYLAPRQHHHGWRTAFQIDFMPEIASANTVYLDLPLEHVPWNAIRNLDSVDTLHLLPSDGNFLPLLDLLRSPASNKFSVKTVALKPFQLDEALKGASSARHLEELDRLASKGSITINRPSPNPPCRVIIDDSTKRPLYGYETMPVAGSFTSYSNKQPLFLARRWE
ncbi:hypothetical protein BKA70DRAFT_1535609 [Coprinopsis sp. MPI-PUGE-AT-0042]|nr:hypothetical protein BKA70DRAFT_1535609 [Coprinopsis sp. MPI-PUGE-AT-0042]